VAQHAACGVQCTLCTGCGATCNLLLYTTACGVSSRPARVLWRRCGCRGGIAGWILYVTAELHTCFDSSNKQRVCLYTDSSALAELAAVALLYSVHHAFHLHAAVPRAVTVAFAGRQFIAARESACHGTLECIRHGADMRFR
jgi:hypothetical protein